jgi:hypothetical protein
VAQNAVRYNLRRSPTPHVLCRQGAGKPSSVFFAGKERENHPAFSLQVRNGKTIQRFPCRQARGMREIYTLPNIRGNVIIASLRGKRIA